MFIKIPSLNARIDQFYLKILVAFSQIAKVIWQDVNINDRYLPKPYILLIKVI